MDGLPGLVNSRVPNPSLVQSKSGRLWFATSLGVAWLDPIAFRTAGNKIAPPVTIESLKSQGRTFSAFETIKLPPRAQNVEIAYTALSLTIPERVRFRYKLEGIDKDWQEPGTRRLAFYAHLPAGAHKFKVTACNNDGVWNEQGAEIAFSIASAFYETWWFKCAVALLALIGVSWMTSLRIRHVRRELENRHAERLSERERIARELHDTLLQSLLAVMMQFEGALSVLKKDDVTKMSLANTLRLAQAVMKEGRDRVRELRTKDGLHPDLDQALSMTAFHLQSMKAVPFEVHVLGKRGELKTSVQEEILLICREALANSFIHAKAKSISVDISFHHRKIYLSVSDDGCGIPTEILSAGGRDEHWGLPGMRERAGKLDGTLRISSKVNKGTWIELSVPGRVAYEKPTMLSKLIQRRGSVRMSSDSSSEPLSK